MPLLRLAYTTQFLIALITVFVVWDEVGGPYHLDLMPWWLKFGLGVGLAYAGVRATASAVGGEAAWNRRTLRWCVAVAVLLAASILANYYCDVAGEQDEQQDGSGISLAHFARCESLSLRFQVHFRIDICRVEREVPQPGTNGVDINPGTEQMGRRRVANGMRTYPLAG
ncbi:MAG TPA: hypothetical protein VHW24_00325 [Bryobacteraceae bacterium]|jgi:hypothetical protein|nr:hypothetical protein [Bryobacteraceae bacterium]